jgi:hypothetical protein
MSLCMSLCIVRGPICGVFLDSLALPWKLNRTSPTKGAWRIASTANEQDLHRGARTRCRLSGGGGSSTPATACRVGVAWRRLSPKQLRRWDGLLLCGSVCGLSANLTGKAVNKKREPSRGATRTATIRKVWISISVQRRPSSLVVLRAMAQPLSSTLRSSPSLHRAMCYVL